MSSPLPFLPALPAPGGAPRQALHKPLTSAPAQPKPVADLATLRAAAHDPSRSARERGEIALHVAARLYAESGASPLAPYGKVDADAARYYLALAYRTSPDVRGSATAERLALLLAPDTEQDSARGLAALRSALKRDPDDLELIGELIEALRAEGQAAQALPWAERAVKLAEARGDSEALKHALREHGLTLWAAGKDIKEFRKPYDRALAIDPLDVATHRAFADMVVPDFQHPRRGEIEREFAAANAAFRAGDYAKVIAHGRAILAIDKNDGLAHGMIGSAAHLDRLRRFAKSYAPPFDDATKRAALRQRFIERMAEAGKKPEDLYPEWNELNEPQQAVVAYSSLAYGKLLGELMRRTPAPRYHLVAIGTSGNSVRDEPELEKPDAFNRSWYGGRGWMTPDRIVTGAEKLDDILHGAYNTITHELAHMIHEHIGERRLGEMPASVREVVRRHHPRINLRLTMNDVIELYYEEAKQRRNGQVLLDSYSGQDSGEYFAQLAMAYHNPNNDGSEESAARLYGRNPRGWELARALAEWTRDFPTGAPAVDHPRSDAGGTADPWLLYRLGCCSPDPAVRREAEALFAEIEARERAASGSGSFDHRYSDVGRRASSLLGRGSSPSYW